MDRRHIFLSHEQSCSCLSALTEWSYIQCSFLIPSSDFALCRYEFSGINRKVQFKYQPSGRPHGTSSEGIVTVHQNLFIRTTVFIDNIKLQYNVIIHSHQLNLHKLLSKMNWDMSVQFPQSSQNSSLFEKSSGDVYIVILAQDNDNTKELQFAVRTTLCLKV